MKKKFLKVVVLAILVLGTNNLNVLAEDNKYQLEKYNNISISTKGSEYKEEFVADKEGLNSLFKLQKKTDSKFEIALAYEDGSYSYVESIESLEEAIIKINKKDIESKGNTIEVVIDSDGRIVYATRAMGRVIKFKDGNPVIVNGEEKGYVANIYEESNLKNAYTYVNTGYIDDVPIISMNSNSANVLISGYNGWMNKESQNGDLAIIPLNQVKNASYYTISGGNLYHYISSDITTSNKGYKMLLGKAPSFMNENVKYYSYDGNYFYKSLELLFSDLEGGHNKNAVNAKNKYYDYYINLPLRSKSIYGVTQLNEFLSYKTVSDSKLRNTGSDLISSQNKYGVNSLIMMGIAANESGWGTSSISKNNNNLFGLGAYDIDPGNNAHKFKSVQECIENFAQGWMSKGYLNPIDWRFKGAVLGNKAYGINVKYASDPFWGEKASSKAYEADKYLGKKDLNNYELGVYNSKINITDEKGNIIYKVDDLNNLNVAKLNTPVIIAKKDDRVISGISNHKINLERPVKLSENYNGEYDWSKKGFVRGNAITSINTKTGSYDMYKNGFYIESGKWFYFEEGIKITGFKFVDGKWYYLDSSGIMQTGWQKINNKWYYFNDAGKMQTGWQLINNKWYYLKDAGDMLETGWQRINNKWYYFSEKGDMKTGWLELDKGIYYLKDNGEMAVGNQTINGKKYFFDSSGRLLNIGWNKVDENWYYLENDYRLRIGWLFDGVDWFYLSDVGKMQQGWVLVDSEWYYMNTSGRMQNGWQLIDSEWYYMNTSGRMQKGWQLINSEWYYMNANGRMQKGWQLIDSEWYYMNTSGRMQKGWQLIDSEWYYMNTSGRMQKGWQLIESEWYYMNTSGRMQKGWSQIEEKWYYLYSNGKMAKNTTIDGVKINSSGVAQL